MPNQPLAPASQPQRDERKRIIAAIIQESSGGRLFGRTRLFKAYWLSHLFFWRNHEGLLTTSHGMVHMPNGPGIDSDDELLDELVREGVIAISSRRAGPFDEDVFKSKKKVEIASGARGSIRQALRYLNGLTATQISDLAHKYSTSWNTTPSGEPLDIYLDLMSDAKLQENKRLLAVSKAAIDDAFCGTR